MTVHQAHRAFGLWRLGFDTFEIAEELGVSEAEVYNYLSVWLTRRKAA